MKSLALLAGIAALAAGTVLGSAASPKTAHHPATFAIGRVQTVFHMKVPMLGRVTYVPESVAAQAATTQTITSTPVGTTTAIATSTPSTPVPTSTATNNYPDPVQLLQNTFTVYELVRSAHYELVTDAERTSVEKLHVDAKGDVTCKNLSINGKLTGSDVIEGTSQKSTLNVRYIRIRNSVYLKSKSSHNKWVKGKAADLDTFGVSSNDILFCTTSSGGSGGNNTQIKDLVNLGPETFQGVPVWHVRATEIVVDPNSGQTQEAQLDFLISQDHFLPYVFMVTADDATTNTHLVQKQILTQFGKKVSIKAPKLGSTKP